ncbi:PREDICTED: inositol oxygenase [Haliaeetus leucocephalus]|uniref:inositol oxygenase n=1 Tax=Haliaeetus leucocephalus TaxID=52644 RepID=UPI00053CEAA5|nr:PREDICTED: inositol oxygenase [Haliaeetus leucocephalus]
MEGDKGTLGIPVTPHRDTPGVLVLPQQSCDPCGLAGRGCAALVTGPDPHAGLPLSPGTGTGSWWQGYNGDPIQSSMRRAAGAGSAAPTPPPAGIKPGVPAAAPEPVCPPPLATAGMRSLRADADPSEEPKSSKAKSEYRNYTEGKLLDRVYNTYLLMHTHQTVGFVRKKSAEYGTCSLRKMSAMEALELLDQLVDESDPDVDFPNSYHAYQTAEGIRRAHPDKDWFHLVGLLHDLGKVLALFGEPQWAVVGDTFPVGCKVQRSVVFGDSTFHDNPDTTDPLYSTEYGMYQPHCGLENVLMSWGHDEYMYRVMKFNNFALPKEAFYMVRFHSFYPWHAHGDYLHLCTEEDLRMLPWVRELNKFDLYTKQEELPDMQQLRGYYQSLINKYCPGQLCW